MNKSDLSKKQNPEEWEIRYTTLDDFPALASWLTDEEALRWFPFSLPEEKEWSLRNWIGYSRFHASLTVTIGGKPCAMATLFLMPYRKLSHLSLFYFIVDKKWRKKGIGTSLLKNLLNLAKNYFHLESLYCEVYEGCPMIPLLEKASFNFIAKQEHFVKEKEGSYRARLLYVKELL